MNRMKKLGAFVLALVLMVTCLPAVQALAAPTGFVSGANALMRTDATYPTAAFNFSAGDTYYTWRLDHDVINGVNQASDLNNTLGASFTNAKFMVNGVESAAMKNLFDVVYTGYDTTNGYSATVALKFKSNIPTTTTLTGTMHLELGGTSSNKVTLLGKVYASKTGQTSANKINGIENGILLNRSVSINGTSQSPNVYLGDLTAKPGTEILLDLYSFNFNWTNGKPGPTSNVTQSQLRSGNITVRAIKRNGSDLIEDVAFYTKNGKTSVRIKFKDELASVDDKKFDYTISLYHNGARNKTTEVVVSGILRNPVINMDYNQDYVDLSDGQVAKPASNNSYVDIYAGNYVTIRSRLFSSRKYYAKANNNYSAADEDMLFKYADIVEIYNINHVNLVANTTTVSFDLDSRYYVYDGSGNYIGMSNTKLPFHTKYYIAAKRINMSTGSGSSGGSSSQPDKPPVADSGTSVVGTDVSVDSAKTATQQGVNTAKQTGGTTAIVKLKNAVNISLDALKAMNTTAGTMPVYVYADTTTSSGGVDVRIGFNPYGRTAGMNLSASTLNSKAVSTKNLFSKWYNGNFAVISFGQKGNFSQTVRVSAKVNLTGINSSSLKFYSYDSAANSYRTLTPTYSIDSNGYLVFDTIVANDIVITDRALTLK